MLTRKIIACFLAATAYLPIGHAVAADSPQWSELPIVERGKVVGRAPMPAVSVEKFCHGGLTMCMTIRTTEEVIGCSPGDEIPPNFSGDGLPIGGPCADGSCEPDPDGSPARPRRDQQPPNGGILRSGTAWRSVRITEEDLRMGDCTTELLDRRHPPSGQLPVPAPEYGAYCFDVGNGLAAISTLSKQYSFVSCSSLGAAR